MDPLMTVYHAKKRNIDVLRYRLKHPISHEYNLPPTIDLRRWMTDIEDQGDMKSCVANAIAGSLEYIHLRNTGQKVNVSRLFIDYNARISNVDWSEQRHLLNRTRELDELFATTRRAALRGLQQYGFCEESLWPYDRNLYLKRPPRRVYKEAQRRSIVPIRVPINIDSIKTCLAHEIPVLIGILLSNDEADSNRGWIEIPKKPPIESGFHACLVVGYDDHTQRFIIRNSWGKTWGDGGYCYVPYQYLIDKRLVSTFDTFWAIAQIIPREMMQRGYISYPNFTLYHQQSMLTQADKNVQRQHLNSNLSTGSARWTAPTRKYTGDFIKNYMVKNFLATSHSKNVNRPPEKQKPDKIMHLNHRFRRRRSYYS